VCSINHTLPQGHCLKGNY